MSEALWAACAFGLAAGLQPGPLLVIVVQQTLLHGLGAGIRASLAPLISDGPIILGTVWLAGQLQGRGGYGVAAALSGAGGIYLLWLAWHSWAGAGERERELTRNGSASFWLAVRVNLLNPNPYLFWLTVGSGYLLQGSATDGMLFIATMLGVLMACKIGIAVLTRRFLTLMNSRGYRAILRLLAIMLAGMACLLLWRGWAWLMTS